MSNDTIFSLYLSIPIGLISGLYAGLVIARYQRFADLRLQAKKIILEIDYISEGTKMLFPHRQDTREFHIIASDLLFLGHTSAGIKMLEISQEIQQSISEAKSGTIDFKKFDEKYLSWQQSIRSLSPKMLQIMRLWGGL